MAELILQDLSRISKWRVFGGYEVRPGTSAGAGDDLVWSVSPGEWTVLSTRPEGDVVDLTHVRCMFRLTGDRAAELLNRICALDLSDGMFPTGAAGRTLVAGVVTELVRDDIEDVPSYLILPSSSFGRYLWGTIEDAGTGLDLLSGDQSG
ncbi:MAG TPA: hypothetical protein VEB69_09525 [Acidimicrobiia bacterium]|nr:hypothetical protein [Acidimicrobiia bacterium]